MRRSLACGCLQHSVTVCIYFLPPQGPSKLDLVAMSALSKHVALLPASAVPEGSTEQETEQLQSNVRKMLADPAAYVPGLERIETYK